MNTERPTEAAAPHRWQFFRSGGFDQVRIDSAEDLRQLHTLDQKLWAVLTCPASGLEFDSRTLQLIDTAGEGRVRAPELLAAVAWVCRMLRDPQLLFSAGDAVPLQAIDTGHDEGQGLHAAARQVLAYLGRPDDDAVSLSDLADPARLFPPDQPNGDGIVPAELTADPVLVQAISTIAQALGAATDRSGRPGIDLTRLDTCLQDAQAVCDWHAQADAAGSAVQVLGAATASAAAAFDTVRAKVEDFHTRCQLAAYDERAAGALNPAEAAYAGLSGQTLSADEAGIAALPLARVAAGSALPLTSGVNPAWAGHIAALRDLVVTPLLGAQNHLTLTQWQDIAARLDAWRQWQAARPATPVADLPLERLQGLLAPEVGSGLRALIQRDLAAQGPASQIDALERLLRLRRDLVTLLRNFVNLADFYAPGRRAIFQAGTLYLDQRSCELCLRVADMGRHAALAPLSGTFLVYCQCTRQGEAPMTIVAAMTGGEADEMLVPGRNGVFYDRLGRDWHASVTKIVANPISVREAFWMPYRRIGRMVSEQVRRFAAEQDRSVDAKAAAGSAELSKKATAAPPATAAPAASQPFDIAKFAGIFAALGLALGALGTALAAVVSGFLALPPWKMPLVAAGIVLLVSGPSMLLAWFKLRQRNLGPLLDANGWAVNIRARINIPFGSALTRVASLPPGARRSLVDPYADPRVRWQPWLVGALVLLALLWFALAR